MIATSHAGNRDKSRVKVGILHSLTGTMAIGEVSLKDAELMAIAEINAQGGVLGKTIEAIVEDGASLAPQFARKAKKLLQTERVVAIFGGWTSATRKAVLPILEEYNAQLWYPVEYEGLESSPHIFYTGICPNQQLEPAVNWAVRNKGKRFYLIGSNYVFPRTLHKMIKAHLKQLGATVVGEEYAPLGGNDFGEIIHRIQKTQPDVVFNTLNGDSNIAFYQQYRNAGIGSEEIPIIAVSVAEDELRRIGPAATGHYSTWSYFQSVDTPTNHKFVRNFKARYGENRVTSDPIEAAYTQVYLWKQAVEKAGTFAVDAVREAAYDQTFEAPGGVVRIERNNHLWKPCRIGEILPNGQFKIVWESDGAIKPLPWLGLEEVSGSVSTVAIDMLAEVSQAIQYSCQMEAKSQQLEAAMAQLKETNQRLQHTQEELLESQRQFRLLRSRVELLKRRLSSQIHTSLNIETILKTAVGEIRTLLDIDRCQFLWYKKDKNRYELSRESWHPQRSHVGGDNAFTHMAALTQPLGHLELLKIDDVKGDPQLDPPTRQMLEARSVKSLLGVGMETHSGERGAIVCLDGTSGHPWTESEIELLQDVAMQLAIAIEQAQLYDRSCIAAAAATAQAEKLKKALEELQQTQAQLIQTEKISGLGTLVAGVAHEINNPVNFIYGNLSYANNYLQELLELVRLYEEHYGEPVPAIQQYVEEIDLEFLKQDMPQMLSSMKIGAERISELVRSLRNFSRTDKGELKLVNIHEGITSTLLILHHRLKGDRTGIAIAVEKEFGELPAIECYSSQLNQVFMNIISNAIDALESSVDSHSSFVTGHSSSVKGSNDIGQTTKTYGQMTNNKGRTIRIRTEWPDPDWVTVRISDNGPGMSEVVQQQLFEAFFTTKPEGKGTGLGMSISYQIVVERHKGEIECVSAPGEGTEFCIKLPVRQTPNLPASPTESETAQVPTMKGGLT
ncbi:urea ABC transporter substrate-binding protein [Phormidium sp. CCY1219]|uniref:urea ABC transporter substrate-binding protein n=1 Tax=Phormidium sp. CCY1219 TaxID=2886104 RepID=UPI002D1EA76F|nr:urea ABC transporter substrate-binding protein [Phormidium sp. CCY1219]MEB3830351.1 urea ABC transporter substrate-binding protein [Phormidium sp. CCY1219]